MTIDGNGSRGRRYRNLVTPAQGSAWAFYRDAAGGAQAHVTTLALPTPCALTSLNIGRSNSTVVPSGSRLFTAEQEFNESAAAAFRTATLVPILVHNVDHQDRWMDNNECVSYRIRANQGIPPDEPFLGVDLSPGTAESWCAVAIRETAVELDPTGYGILPGQEPPPPNHKVKPPKPKPPPKP